MNIVIIAAHPDDAECSCGGLILKAVSEGHKVHILTFTNGDKYGNVADRSDLQELRECEAKAAANFSGAEVHFLRNRDRELQFNPGILELTCDYLVKLEADIVLAHWPADQHPDHQICGVLATQAILALPNIGLAYFEASIGSQTFGMTPNRYFDISDVADKKKQMIGCYVSQGVENILRIREIMDRWHGANAGVEYAEAFYMHKSTRKSEEFFL